MLIYIFLDYFLHARQSLPHKKSKDSDCLSLLFQPLTKIVLKFKFFKYNFSISKMEFFSNIFGHYTYSIKQEYNYGKCHNDRGEDPNSNVDQY